MLSRVTNLGQSNQAVAFLQRQSSDLARVQNQISSGVRITRPSDDPSAFAILRSGKATDARFDAYRETISDATSTLNQGVTSLTDVHNALTQAKQVAQQAINATTEPAAFEALAAQIDSVLNRVLGSANAKADGNSLFAGTATNTDAFTVTSRDAQGRILTVAYQGTDEVGQGLIGPDQTVDTRYRGNRIFQEGAADLFQTLVGLRDAIRDTTSPSQTRIDTITARFREVEIADTQVLNTIGQQSADLNNLQAVGSKMEELQLEIKTRNADLETTDIADAVVRLRGAENTLQATLAVSARLFDNSLLDFIR